MHAAYKKMKKSVKKILATVLTATVVSGAVFLRIFSLLEAPVTSKESFKLYITPGFTQESVLDSIRNRDSDANVKGLRLWLNHRNYQANIHTGCYTVNTGASAREVANMLSGGAQTPVRLKINSVRTVDRMAALISSQLMMDSTQVITLLTDKNFLDSIGYSPATAFCIIIPNTYEVWWNISPEGLFRRLLQEKDKFWNNERKTKAASLGMDENQVMTLASIVEEETAKSDELPVVAGLYINRLKRGMPLQADPTVIFALGGERPKRVLNTHLEIDSPYNTYKITGLPPAPIRFVNISSIDAVLNYSKHNYLYMCAKEDFSGYHNFATTLSQHNANAARYRQALNRAGIR